MKRAALMAVVLVGCAFDPAGLGPRGGGGDAGELGDGDAGAQPDQVLVDARADARPTDAAIDARAVFPCTFATVSDDCPAATFPEGAYCVNFVCTPPCHNEPDDCPPGSSCPPPGVPEICRPD